MRMGHNPTKKSLTILKSPQVSAMSKPHYVTFYYYVFSQYCPEDNCGYNALTLAVEMADGSTVNVWTVRNLNVFSYLPARARIPAGSRRLVFVNSAETGASGIDDITVYDDVPSDGGLIG